MDYGCIGQRLSHSFSKNIHESIGRYSYELKELELAELPAFIESRQYRGLNVTIPYKQAVIPYLDELSERASRIGAVNIILNRGGRLYGDNTDFGGMLALLGRMGLEVEGKKALVLGTGGTSRTVCAVLESLGAGETVRVSRSADRQDAVTYEQACKLHKDADIIINTTPCGMFPHTHEQPIALECFPNLCGVVDAVYNPLRSRLVLQARERGIPAAGGLYMLVKQAVMAAELFTDLPLTEEQTQGVYNRLLAERQNLVLIGMPGCGKTAVGRLLAQELDRELIDVDELIVAQAGRPISEIFADDGEDRFRQLETEAIADIAGKNGLIIATGGGAVLNEENTVNLSQNGKLILLDRPLELLLPTSDRPLADNEEKMRRLYRERRSLYQKAADQIVKAEDPPETVARSIIRSMV